MNKGLIHIYTGDGKGKTTSAVGLACRALGHKLKVCYVHFHKNPEKYGYTEIKNLKNLGAEIHGFAKEHPFCEVDAEIDVIAKEVYDGLNFINNKIHKQHFDLLIMDEVLISIRDGFLKESELVNFINSKPKHLEVVLTGRDATKKLIELADYVSFVKKVKHPYDKGITSRKGIEF